EDSRVHAIYLLDSPDKIRSSVMKATTDSLREIRFDESRPGIYNLLILYELFSNVQRDEIEARFEGKGYSDLKKELSEVIIEGLRPLQSRYRDLTDDPTYIDSVLSDGTRTIRPRAEKVLTKVKTLMGLG
ncbi:MAG: tryptophan--tRNA ligase, partial [Deltaproteobacteria bacterium]|nr:tryptophan--tRNA ligase [Deltaproteobacteria bacterium]